LISSFSALIVFSTRPISARGLPCSISTIHWRALVDPGPDVDAARESPCRCHLRLWCAPCPLVVVR
jgi:hypothetical protein